MYSDQEAEVPKLLAEIERLKRVILNELNENDELGAEYTYVNVLRADNKILFEQLEDYRFRSGATYFDELKRENADLKARLAILRRYHGGDGSITREQAIEVLGI